MAARNADSMTNAQGEFNPHRPRDEPLTTKGHQPGLKTSPADQVPEFHAQTLPAGTAPAKDTFTPNTTPGVPGQSDAALSFPGATSATVHTGLGHPGSGQTSTETRHGGQHTATRDASGHAGQGPGGLGLHGEQKAAEFRQLAREDPRSQDNGVSRAGAEDKLPVRSEELASEGPKVRAGGP